MKLLRLALLLGAAWSGVAMASPPQEERIELDCAHIALPSQVAVARLTGYDNIGQAYAARAKLVAEGQRVCQREGVARVHLLWQPAGKVDVGVPQPRVAQR